MLNTSSLDFRKYMPKHRVLLLSLDYKRQVVKITKKCDYYENGSGNIHTKTKGMTKKSPPYFLCERRDSNPYALGTRS